MNQKYAHNCRHSCYTADGHRYLIIENDLIRLGLLVTKGADIVEFRFKPMDCDLLWKSDRPLPPAQGFIPETSQGWDSFFDFFVGGWQESFPTGNTTGVYHLGNGTLHGEVSMLPWEYRVIEASSERIQISVRTRCRRSPFSLERIFQLEKGSAEIVMRERIQNHSPVQREYAWGHHPNFGSPFLSDQCQLDLPAGTYSTREALEFSNPRLQPEQTADSTTLTGIHGQSIDFRKAPPPNNQTWDNVEIKLAEDEAGRFAIRNPELGFGFGMTWDETVFPYLWEWEVSGGWNEYPFWGSEYLLALEPFNCPIGGGLHNLGDQGKLPTLSGKGELETVFRFGICSAGKIFQGNFLQSQDIRVSVD